jgi:hypothetical protein
VTAAAMPTGASTSLRYGYYATVKDLSQSGEVFSCKWYGFVLPAFDQLTEELLDK